MSQQIQEALELEEEHYKHNHGNLWALALAALGVVYGDIGTSPLYALKECFHGNHAIHLSTGNIYGVLSLAFWSLTIVICIKYLIFVTRADNRGEGGMFALLALIPTEHTRISKQARSFVVLAALLGASLLYGDGIITPTISVLSAIEGLEVATSSAKNITVPITCVILFFLFYVQKFGTAKIGQIFGPIMLLWFFTLATLGLINVIHYPAIFAAINPMYAFNFFMENGYHGFLILGSVVLCITGGEALYADMGHFGRKPIQLSWFTFVFPALILNYFGQGALLLSNPLTASNPFFSMVPKFLIFPMVILATAATVIASQALISGVFSITRQGIQLGFLPRLNIIHTSSEAEGQIYIPSINKLMMIACILIVIVFKQSSNLASAYGLAVTADMVLTSTVFFFVLTRTWRWPLYKAFALISFFLVFDLAYFGANVLKFFDGGWFPFSVAMLVLNIMLIWRDGRAELGKQIKSMRLKGVGTGYLSALSVQDLAKNTNSISETSLHHEQDLPLDVLLSDLLPNISRVSGTAVFMSVSLKGVPPVLLHHLKHNQVLHKQVVFLSIKSLDMPVVRKNKIKVHEIGHGFYQIVALYGFMEIPNVPDIIKRAEEFGLMSPPESTTYYLGRETLVISPRRATMMNWRKTIFTFMSRNAQPATSYFSIPPSRVVELGMQIEI
ncbi:MAG: KUP/HAK/KT family potassium transporter [Candidatus Sericytochromatia bacterium]